MFHIFGPKFKFKNYISQCSAKQLTGYPQLNEMQEKHWVIYTNSSKFTSKIIDVFQCMNSCLKYCEKIRHVSYPALPHYAMIFFRPIHKTQKDGSIC